MNTIKSVMVVGALVVVGYGVYVVLNNNPAPPTPDWIKAQTLPGNAPATVQMGDSAAGGGVPMSLGTPMAAPGSALSPAGSPAPSGAPAGASSMSPAPPFGQSAMSSAPAYGQGAATSAPPYGAVTPGVANYSGNPAPNAAAAGAASPYGTSAGSAPPAASMNLYGPQGANPAPAMGNPLTMAARPAGVPGFGGAPPTTAAAAMSPYRSPTGVAPAGAYGQPSGVVPASVSGSPPSGSALSGSPTGANPMAATGAGIPSGAAPQAGVPAGAYAPSSSYSPYSNAAAGGTPAMTASLPGGPSSTPSPYGNSAPVGLRSPVASDASAAGQTNVYETTMAAAKSQLDRGQLDTALLTLSQLYDDPRVTDKQQEQLCDLMDQVAGTVIYSRKYPLESPYRVAAGEQWPDVAQKFSVPAGLLAKINGMDERSELKPGQELKVIRGPFQAIVNTSKKTMGLMVGGRYAGRVQVSLGPEFAQLEGRYVVTEKKRDGGRYAVSMELGPISSPSSPMPLAVVGMTDTTVADRGEAQGMIAVSAKTAEDLFNVLSKGSKVTIHK